MGVPSFEDLLLHVGHDIVCVKYAKGKQVWNVALECETCNEVLVSFDHPSVKDPRLKPVGL